jgi:ribosomal protein S27E
MISAMETEYYWRTRTIAEAQAQGYSHLRAKCPDCGRIADLPWPLLIGRKGTNRNTFLGNIPLKCQRCGNTTPIIGVRNSA